MNKIEKRPTFPCIICGKRFEHPYGFWMEGGGTCSRLCEKEREAQPLRKPCGDSSSDPPSSPQS